MLQAKLTKIFPSHKINVNSTSIDIVERTCVLVSRHGKILTRSFNLVLNPAEKKKMADKPLLRRKSDLPADILTQKSLESYQVNILLAISLISHKEKKLLNYSSLSKG